MASDPALTRITMPSTGQTTGGATRARLRAAFDALVDIAPPERAAWLEANIADPDERAALLRLLAADSGDGFLDTSVVEHSTRLHSQDLKTEGLIGKQIGAFRVIRALGQGGMAAVFLAERTGADFTQKVAIKLLRRGLYSELEQRLFLRERQVLAALSHPHIARLIDGGVTDAGVPYLVMEYVDGTPITRYVAEQRLGLRQIVELFLTACRAVEAAHRNLIVHRDIKPSNILVSTEGMVKLLDFGIAKLIEEDTDATGTIGVFTPDYAAPEQLRGAAITTATDVYGLGVLLHELVLGVRPDGSPTRRPSSRVNEIVRDAASPVRAMAPARLRKLLRGDLDNILLKSLAEEPERRYASASALADDIERYLQRRPVAAHPPSRLYRARKFVQRHRGGVALTTIFLLGILSALGLALWQADVARREATRANSVRDFLIDLFDSAKANLPRNERPTPETLVREAIRRARDDSAMRADLRADLLLTLGSVSMSLGDYAQAEALIDEAIALDIGLGDASHRLAAQVRKADIEQRTNRNADADRLLASMLPDLRSRETKTAVEGLMLYAATQLYAGRLDSSIAVAREAAAKAQRIWPADSLDAIKVAALAGEISISARRDKEGLALLEPVVARWRQMSQDNDFGQALMLLADARERGGDLAGAEAAHREGIALYRRIYDRPHDALATALDDFATFLIKRERFDEAQGLLEEALAINRKVLGEQSLETASALDSLGVLEGSRRAFAASERYLRDSLAIYDAHVNEAGHEKDQALVRNHLAQTLTELGKLDEAQALSDKALAGVRALFGEKKDLTCGVLVVAARIALHRGDAPGALSISTHALDVLSQLDTPSPRMEVLARQARALALNALGKPGVALEDVTVAITALQKAAPDAHARRAGLLALQARLQRSLNQDAAATASIEEARALKVAAGLLAPEDAATLGYSAD